MLRCAGRIATIVALCSAIGLHWVALQSVAWTKMIADYSRHVSLGEAVARTFDGAHPCSLCHAVSAGKNSEKKSDLQSPSPKIDMLLSAKEFRFLPRFVSFQYAAFVTFVSDCAHSPPVPPPRARLS